MNADNNFENAKPIPLKDVTFSLGLELEVNKKGKARCCDAAIPMQKIKKRKARSVNSFKKGWKKLMEKIWDFIKSNWKTLFNFALRIIMIIDNHNN